MAHEMGHGGSDMGAMVRDMRNRFWICLVFTHSDLHLRPDGRHVAGTGAAVRLGSEPVAVLLRHRRGGVSELAVLRLRLARAQEGHAGHGGTHRVERGHRLSLQCRHHLLLQGRRAVLRGSGRAAGVHPAWPLARNARARRCVVGHQGADEPDADQGQRHSQRCRGRSADCRGVGRRHRRHPARQQDPGRWHDRIWRITGRRIDAHWRVDAGEERARRHGGGCQHQQERQLPLQGHQGRGRLGAGPDREAGAGGAELEGASAITGRPRRAMAGGCRHRHRPRDIRGVVLGHRRAAAAGSDADDHGLRDRLSRMRSGWPHRWP